MKMFPVVEHIILGGDFFACTQPKFSVLHLQYSFQNELKIQSTIFRLNSFWVMVRKISELVEWCL